MSFQRRPLFGYLLAPSQYDFIWRADAIDIRRAIRNDKIARVDHSKIDVKSRLK